MFDLFPADGLVALTIVVLALTSALFWTAVMGRTLFASAIAWFMLTQVLFLIGTMLYADLRSRLDWEWVGLNLAALVAFLLGAVATNAINKFNVRNELHDFRNSDVVYDIQGATLIATYLTAVVSIVIGTIFAVAVGYNVFTSALSDYVNTGDFDSANYRTMRISISVDRYVAVGYSLQFTAIILPVVIFILYLRAVRTRRVVDAIVTAVVTVADTYFLTITGGRGWLLHVGVLFLLLFSRFGPMPRARQSPVHKVIAAIVLIGSSTFYALASRFMGRLDDGAAGGQVLASDVLVDFFNRTMGKQAGAELFLMRHFMAQDPVWGAEWFDSLASLIPINRTPHGFGSMLHAMVNNNDSSGSMGLTIWGSCWYNWGTTGTLVLAFVLGVLMQWLTVIYIRGPRSLLRVTIWFIAGYRLTSFHDPYTLLLEGFPTVMILYGILRMAARYDNRVAGKRTARAAPALSAPAFGVAGRPARATTKGSVA